MEKTRTKVLVLKGLQFPMLFGKVLHHPKTDDSFTPYKNEISRVTDESFRVHRPLLKEYLPKKLIFSKKFHDVLVQRKIFYVTRAVTFDKCYYDKYTLNGPSKAFISGGRNSSWYLMGCYGPSISLQQCQNNLLDEGWLFLAPLKPRKVYEQTHKIKPIEIESPIYEAFKPDALLAWTKQQEAKDKFEEFRLEQAIIRKHEEILELEQKLEKVRPVITHPKTSEVDKSLNALDLGLRLEAKKLIKEQASLFSESELKPQEASEKQFRTKKEMLAYIKAKMLEKDKE